MKKLIVLMLIGIMFLFACGSDKSVRVMENGRCVAVTGEQHGLFNMELRRNSVKYRVVKANVVLSIIFAETIVVPVVLVGWYLWEPYDQAHQEPCDKTD